MRKFPSSIVLPAILALLLSGCAAPPPPADPAPELAVRLPSEQGVPSDEIDHAIARVETGIFAEVDQLKRKLCLLQHEKEERLLYGTSNLSRYRLRYGDG